MGVNRVKQSKQSHKGRTMLRAGQFLSRFLPSLNTSLCQYREGSNRERNLPARNINEEYIIQNVLIPFLPLLLLKMGYREYGY